MQLSYAVVNMLCLVMTLLHDCSNFESSNSLGVALKYEEESWEVGGGVKRVASRRLLVHILFLYNMKQYMLIFINNQSYFHVQSMLLAWQWWMLVFQ